MYQVTTTLKKIQQLKKKIRGVQGGTSSSKTISILLLLIDLAQRDTKPTLTSVVAESLPHIRRGALRDFKNIMKTHRYWKEDRWSETNKTYTFETGSEIEFFGADDDSKLRGARRDRLFINEANNVSFQAFEELEVRTKEFVFIDYNPVQEFWFFTDVKDKRDDVDHIIVTYLDNEAVPEEIKKSIEQRKDRKDWWRVFGLGQLGELEGKIYKDWNIIDELPHEARLERYGLDFGYSCLVGDTLVPTIDGNKKIEDILPGDMVLTRSGYKKVLFAHQNGFKDVYDIDFGYGRSIIVTGEHRIFTDRGWIRADELKNKETICVLNHSNLTEESTKDTRKENTQTIFSIKEKDSVEDYIEIYTKKNTEKYPRGLLYTILMEMHSTTMLVISSLFLRANILKFIILTLKQVLLPFRNIRCLKVFYRLGTQKKIGKIEEANLLKLLGKGFASALSVAQKLYQQTHTKSFVVQGVEKKPTQDKALQNMCVKTVEINSEHQRITHETHVLQSVHINSHRLKEKKAVFEISVEGEREFFANGVLVHNCDPTAIVAVYYYNGGYILDEVCFQKGLSNKQIADIILSNPKALVIADSAEPKSIDEIALYGVTILPARKGQDSVRNGIQTVQAQRISVTKRSVNLIKAYRNYMWAMDKNGAKLNVPDHLYSDIMDATRYAITSLQDVASASVKQEQEEFFYRNRNRQKMNSTK